MQEPFDNPFGTSQHRRRLGEAETAERMLQTGVRMVSEVGLQVSFDALRLEEVITAAGVARSAVYKRWPRKEQYYAELLLRLASQAHAATTVFESSSPSVVLGVAQQNLELFDSQQGRKSLLVEMCRQGAQHNYDSVVSRPDWSIYVTLHAALQTLPDNDFRNTLRCTLNRAEQEFAEKVTYFYERIINILGYRVSAQMPGTTISQLAMMGAAAVEGVAIRSAAMLEMQDNRLQMDPFQTGSTRAWSHVSLLFTSLVVSCLEPDPGHGWKSDEIKQVPVKLGQLRDEMVTVLGTANDTTQ